jgi:hypothetical protein
MSYEYKNVIGYFHVCQKGDWKRSFDLIFSMIKISGLYDRTLELRIGIVNNKSTIIDDERFNDPKIKIIGHDHESKYERPTLLHMRQSSELDPSNTCYYYLHTKGLRHFDTPTESSVIDWIHFLLYWNIYNWKIALRMLLKYDTYGCNAIARQHYSGNFWWANIHHVKSLSKYIPDYYTAPEDYICTKNNKMFNIFSSGLQGDGHYSNNYPKENYMVPKDFDIDVYYYGNKDLHHLNYEELINHYLDHGKNEDRYYKMPDHFNFDKYREYYSDLRNFNDTLIVKHWFEYGQYEDRIYK